LEQGVEKPIDQGTRIVVVGRKAPLFNMKKQRQYFKCGVDGMSGFDNLGLLK